MFIKIQRVNVGRQDGPNFEDYHHIPGLAISLSWNKQNWQVIGINDGLTLQEAEQLRSALVEALKEIKQ